LYGKGGKEKSGGRGKRKGAETREKNSAGNFGYCPLNEVAYVVAASDERTEENFHGRERMGIVKEGEDQRLFAEEKAYRSEGGGSWGSAWFAS